MKLLGKLSAGLLSVALIGLIAPSAIADPVKPEPKSPSEILKIEAIDITDSTMTPEELAKILDKPGGVVTRPDAANPGFEITDWPEEGISRTVQRKNSAARSAGQKPSVADSEWYCETKIPEPVMVVGGLQWGGEQVCQGDYTPQWIEVRLEDSCVGPFCWAFETKRGPYRSPVYQDYTRVSKQGFVTGCTNNEERTIRSTVERWNHGINYGRLSYPDKKMNCHIKL